MRIQRHNEGLEKICQELAKGKFQKWFFVADLPGWRPYDQRIRDVCASQPQERAETEGTPDLANDTKDSIRVWQLGLSDSESDVDEDPHTQRERHPDTRDAHPQPWSQVNGSPQADTDEQPYPPEEPPEEVIAQTLISDHFPSLGFRKTEPPPPRPCAPRRSRRQKRLAFRRGRLVVLDEPDADPLGEAMKEMEQYEEDHKQVSQRLARTQGFTPSGLPTWCKFFLNKRPDGIIIEGLTFENRYKIPTLKERKKLIIHILEYTCTSEAYLDQAAANKREQHKEIVQHLRNQGFIVQLHVLIMGVRGWMPEQTWSALETLGVAPMRRKKLYTKLSRLNTRRSVEIIWTRAALEQKMKRRTNDLTRRHMPWASTTTIGRQDHAKAKKILRTLRRQEQKLGNSTQRKKKQRKKDNEG